MAQVHEVSFSSVPHYCVLNANATILSYNDISEIRQHITEADVCGACIHVFMDVYLLDRYIGCHMGLGLATAVHAGADWGVCMPPDDSAYDGTTSHKQILHTSSTHRGIQQTSGCMAVIQVARCTAAPVRCNGVWHVDVGQVGLALLHACSV